MYVKRLTPKEHKLQSKYIGPYRIIGKTKDAVTVRNLYNCKEMTVHLSYVNVIHENELFHKDPTDMVNMGVLPQTPYDIDEIVTK